MKHDFCIRAGSPDPERSRSYLTPPEIGTSGSTCRGRRVIHWAASNSGTRLALWDTTVLWVGVFELLSHGEWIDHNVGPFRQIAKDLACLLEGDSTLGTCNPLVRQPHWGDRVLWKLTGRNAFFDMLHGVVEKVEALLERSIAWFEDLVFVVVAEELDELLKEGVGLPRLPQEELPVQKRRCVSGRRLAVRAKKLVGGRSGQSVLRESALRSSQIVGDVCGGRRLQCSPE
jgi:hypothetical protein